MSNVAECSAPILSTMGNDIGTPTTHSSTVGDEPEIPTRSSFPDHEELYRDNHSIPLTHRIRQAFRFDGLASRSPQ